MDGPCCWLVCLISVILSMDKGKIQILGPREGAAQDRIKEGGQIGERMKQQDAGQDLLVESWSTLLETELCLPGHWRENIFLPPT